MKKKLAFLLGISPNFAFAAGNVAIALNKYCHGDSYDILVYHSGLSLQDCMAFERIPHCRLEYFTFEDEFIDYMMKTLPDECRFKTKDRLMCFVHFEAFDLLKKYQYVIWLDADILVRDDLQKLVQFGPLAFSADGFSVGEQFVTLPQCKYDLSREAIRIGMMVFGDTLPYKEMYQWCYKNAMTYAKYAKNPEQAVMNLCLQEFELEVTTIPLLWHSNPDGKEAEISKCVHFGTEKKIWNDRTLFAAYPEWYLNHFEWMELGGSVSGDYKLENDTPRDILNKFINDSQVMFMFDKVPAKSKIIIYGGGRIGHKYVEQIQRINYCTIECVLDRNAQQIEGFSIPVLSPENIRRMTQYDYVVIALKAAKMICEAEQFLLESGVPREKIVSSHSTIQTNIV